MAPPGAALLLTSLALAQIGGSFARVGRKPTADATDAHLIPKKETTKREQPQEPTRALPVNPRRLTHEECASVAVSGVLYQSNRQGTYRKSGTCDSYPFYVCDDCSSTSYIWYYATYSQWMIGESGCGSSIGYFYGYDSDADLPVYSQSGSAYWYEWSGSSWVYNSALSLTCYISAPTQFPTTIPASGTTPRPSISPAPTSGTTNHGAGNGWCYSDLDEHVGSAASAGDCWAMCLGYYGDGLVAIDWEEDGTCYCQNDCQCMAEVGDNGVYLITRDSRVGAQLPGTCDDDDDDDDVDIVPFAAGGAGAVALLAILAGLYYYSRSRKKGDGKVAAAETADKKKASAEAAPPENEIAEREKAAAAAAAAARKKEIAEREKAAAAAAAKSGEPVKPAECVVMVGFNHGSAGDKAVLLTNLLCADGIPTFCTDVFCPRGRVGSNWQKHTTRGVKTCKYFVPLMTNGWQKSEECQDETNKVYQRYKHKEAEILPVRFPDFDTKYDDEQDHFWADNFSTMQQMFVNDTNDDVNDKENYWMHQVKVSIQNMLKEKAEADKAK
jgi:hypothetical protein